MLSARQLPSLRSSTRRDFEIAIAITTFGPAVALATVVGPLIEVPVMLALVWGAMRLRRRLFGAAAERPRDAGRPDPEMARARI